MVTEDGEEYKGLYQSDVDVGTLVTLVSPSKEFSGKYNVHEVVIGDHDAQPTPIRENISPDQLDDILDAREKVMGVPTRRVGGPSAF